MFKRKSKPEEKKSVTTTKTTTAYSSAFKTYSSRTTITETSRSTISGGSYRSVQRPADAPIIPYNRSAFDTEFGNANAIDARPTGAYTSPYRNYNSSYSTILQREQKVPATSYLAYPTSQPNSVLQQVVAPKKPTTNTNNTVLRQVTKSLADKMQPGVMYIFNHSKFDGDFSQREGTYVDVKRLKETFGKLKLTIKVFENKTLREIQNEIAKIQRENYSKKSCIVITILTHGHRHDHVSARDQLYNIDDIILFPMLKNSTLTQKPKIFIVQACKGDYATKYPLTDAAKTNIYPANEIVKLYSSFEGFVSYRSANGSVFIQKLCDIIDRCGKTENIVKIMDMTRSAVRQEMGGDQIPTITHNLSKDFCFGNYV